MTMVTGVEFVAASMAIESAYLIFRQRRLTLCGIGHVIEATKVSNFPIHIELDD
jgi:hypothetical protein